MPQDIHPQKRSGAKTLLRSGDTMPFNYDNGNYDRNGYCVRITGEWFAVKRELLKRQCEGKVIYKTFKQALKAAYRSESYNGEEMHAYECENCCLFHVGHVYSSGYRRRNGHGRDNEEPPIKYR